LNVQEENLMDNFFLLMWKPLLACLILTGIHTYLGVHVIERKVIFVDLALAQIAALVQSSPSCPDSISTAGQRTGSRWGPRLLEPSSFQ